VLKCCLEETTLTKIVDIVFSYYAKIYILTSFSNKHRVTFMTQESIQRSKHETETPLLGSHVKSFVPRRKIVTRAAQALSEVGMLGLLVILAAAESVKHRRAPPHGDIEQLREYGDWVD
jgi:hypothetical protein